MDNLAATIEEAAAGLHEPGEPVAPFGVYCLAGLDLTVDERRLGEAVTAAGWTDRCELRNDAFAVLRAGTTAPCGVGVVCGTGLNCVGVGPDGAQVRFPSLGRALRRLHPRRCLARHPGVGPGAAGRRRPGQAGPALRHLVPDHLGFAYPEDVLEAVYSGDWNSDGSWSWPGWCSRRRTPPTGRHRRGRPPGRRGGGHGRCRRGAAGDVGRTGRGGGRRGGLQDRALLGPGAPRRTPPRPGGRPAPAGRPAPGPWGGAARPRRTGRRDRGRGPPPGRRSTAEQGDPAGPHTRTDWMLPIRPDGCHGIPERSSNVEAEPSG